MACSLLISYKAIDGTTDVAARGSRCTRKALSTVLKERLLRAHVSLPRHTRRVDLGHWYAFTLNGFCHRKERCLKVGLRLKILKSRVVLGFWLAGIVTYAIPQETPRCISMAVPIVALDDAPEPYRDFCLRNEGSCDLSGPEILEWSPELLSLLQETNASVNGSLQFSPDPENSGLEEYWDYPKRGVGDCEDFVLEKRRLLVEAGLPSASLTCGIAFHEVQLYPHAILFAETTAGTFVLDNLHDEVMCWDALPYFYTRRERADGQWMRFQQP